MNRAQTSVAAILFVLSVVAAAWAQPASFSVGNITAQPGERISGFLPVPAGVDEGTQIPITIIHGRQPGPVLAVVAGIHGYEYAPILALQRLPAKLNPEEISGTVIFVHIANLPSFLRRTIYYNPLDGKNQNRVFPGKADGTQSERIAYVLTEEVIARADFLVDLHGGDGNEALRPYTYWVKSGNATVDAQTQQLALAFGHDHIIIDTSRPNDPARAVTCANTAITRGKPAITSETGLLGSTEERWVAQAERGVMSVLRHLRLLKGEPRRVEHPLWVERWEVLRSEVAGIFYPQVEKDQSVARGTLLGTLTDFFGKKIGEVRAPFAGVVLYVVATPPVSAGEPLVMLGQIRVEPEE